VKGEVIVQGIEFQHRWTQDQGEERGGRLAQLDELAANFKRLERVALDNSTTSTRICAYTGTPCGRLYAPSTMPSMCPCGIRSATSCACSATRQRCGTTPSSVLPSKRATRQTSGSSLWRTLRRGSRRASHPSRVSRLCRMRALACSLLSLRMCC